MEHEAAWHPDPQDPSQLRWWDGTQWTEHTAPIADTVGSGSTTLGSAPATSPTTGHAPAPSSGLANSTLFASENREQSTTGRMTRQNPAVVKVTLGAPLLVTRGAMIAYQGDVQFAYEGSGAKRFVKASLTGEGVRLMRCTGAGELFVSHHSRKLHLLELAAGEQVSASSRALLGFDDTIAWDINAIKGGLGAAAAGGLFNVTLTGPGTVILASDWPVVLDTSEARTCVDPNAVVAWTAGLQIQVRSSFSAGALVGRGSGEAFQLEFSPGGFVVVEPEGIVHTVA
jgi:uncharacterized protein (AIM24 family)